MLLSVAFSLGIAAATAMAGFLATSSVASGVGKGTAGLLVALGGVAAFIARVMAGVRADRRDGRHLRAVAVMLLAGAGGYVLIALASGTGSVALLVPGVTLAFASGWGWNGLFNFSVVRSYADRPAQATAITQAGGRVGGVVGPLLFGFAASHASYATAWVGAAAAAVVSAVMVSVARHELRSRARRTTSLVPVTDPSLGD